MGSNNSILNRHLEVVLEYISTIIVDANIEYVIGVGSLQRRYADEYSDIDLGIIHSGDNLPIAQGETMFQNFPIDKIVIHESYMKQIPTWPIWMREVFQDGILLYSKQKGFNWEKLRRKICPKEDELIFLITETLLELAWHGISSRHLCYGIPYNPTDRDFLVRRYGETGAQVYLGRAVEIVLNLFYCAARRYPPASKWLVYSIPNCTELISGKLNEFYANNSISGKLDSICDLLNESIRRLMAENLIPDNLFTYYTDRQQNNCWGYPQIGKA